MLVSLIAALQQPKFVDLADQKQFQVLVDREPGQYLGHPTTALLPDGKTILCVYPKGHGKGGILMKRSLDGGKTWSERLPTPKNWETSLETPTIHLVRDPGTGNHRLLLWSGLYPARIASSDDLGNTWTELAPVGKWGGIVVMGHLEQRSDGRIFAYFHDDGRFFTQGGKAQGTFTLYRTESNDGGRTWRQPTTMWSGSDVHLCEPGVIPAPSGPGRVMLLRENRRIKNSHMMVSQSEGSAWSKPTEVGNWLTGDRHTGKYAPDGRLVISFRDMDKQSPTWGDWVAWVGTYEDLLLNRPGQYRIRLMDNTKDSDCAYPGVEVLSDGTFVLTTYGHWTKGEPPYIMSVRFRLSEIDALATR